MSRSRFRIGEVCFYWIYGSDPDPSRTDGWYRSEIINEEFLFGRIRYTLKILDGAYINVTETDVYPHQLRKL